MTVDRKKRAAVVLNQVPKQVPERVQEKMLWIRTATLPVTAVILLLVFLDSAWVSEDAHITFRTVVNFTNGDGLRWNLDDRVQVFTHPLWTLLISAAYAITDEFYFTVTAISLVLSVSAYVLLARLRRDSVAVMIFALFMPLVFSTAVVKYATSGFENSLTLFWCALFVSIALRVDRDAEIPVGKLALVAALAAVNRLDTILLFLPALAIPLLGSHRMRALRQLVLGFVPLVAWLSFSLFYFGFLFPNTAYAKLSADVSRQVYLAKGVRYYADLIQNDPVTGLMLSAGIAVSLGLLIRLATQLASSRRDAVALRLASLGGGILLYSAYVVWVGGDFLSGRFWVAPAFLSVALCAAQLDRSDAIARLRSPKVALATVLVFVGYLFGSNWMAAEIEQRTTGRILPHGPARVLLSRELTWEPTTTATVLTMMGWKTRQQTQANPDFVVKHMAIGFLGMAAGRDATIVDGFALADPLMARMPPTDVTHFKTGHLRRTVPIGYLEARETGSVEGMDPALAEYYLPLRLIVSGPLFDRERLETIVRFNLGHYDHYRADYVARERKRWFQSP